MNTEIEKIEIKGLVFYSNNDNRYTISYDGSGGAIVSNEDLHECKRKFEEAMKVSVVFKNLQESSKGKIWGKIKSFTYSSIKHV